MYSHSAAYVGSDNMAAAGSCVNSAQKANAGLPTERNSRIQLSYLHTSVGRLVVEGVSLLLLPAGSMVVELAISVVRKEVVAASEVKTELVASVTDADALEEAPASDVNAGSLEETAASVGMAELIASVIEAGSLKELAASDIRPALSRSVTDTPLEDVTAPVGSEDSEVTRGTLVLVIVL